MPPTNGHLPNYTFQTDKQDAFAQLPTTAKLSVYVAVWKTIDNALYAGNGIITLFINVIVNILLIEYFSTTSSGI